MHCSRSWPCHCTALCKHFTVHKMTQSEQSVLYTNCNSHLFSDLCTANCKPWAARDCAHLIKLIRSPQTSNSQWIHPRIAIRRSHSNKSSESTRKYARPDGYYIMHYRTFAWEDCKTTRRSWLVGVNWTILQQTRKIACQRPQLQC